jgi:hypothetical protein
VIYFAYGSNMDPGQMAERCPGYRTIGVARLNGHRLSFPRFSPVRRSATASIEPEPGSAVWGVLYELPADDLPVLHHLEGYNEYGAPEANRYNLAKVTVQQVGGGTAEAMTYVAVPDDSAALPTADYMARLVDGARFHGLPRAYVATLTAVKTAG